MVSREDLGIREVDTAEALAAAGLRYVRCAAGEIVPQEVGLYLLDVETGAVEGWVLASAPAVEAYEETGGFIDAGVSLSPGNRFLSFDRFRHDRVTERTFEWDAPPLRRWGSDSERRLLFRLADERGDLFVVTDGTLQPVAQFAIPDGQEGQLQWLNFEYRSLVVRGQERDGGLHSSLHFFDFNEEAIGTFEPAATQVLPGTRRPGARGGTGWLPSAQALKWRLRAPTPATSCTTAGTGPRCSTSLSRSCRCTAEVTAASLRMATG